MLESVEIFVNNEVNGYGESNEVDSLTPRSDDNFDDGFQDDYRSDDESSYAFSPRESWQSTRSTSPTTAAILNSSSRSSVTKPKPYTESSARLAAIFPSSKSSKAKALLVAVKTVSASLKCISESELKYIASTQNEVIAMREKYRALVHDHQRICQEIEVSILKSKMWWIFCNFYVPIIDFTTSTQSIVRVFG